MSTCSLTLHAPTPSSGWQPTLAWPAAWHLGPGGRERNFGRPPPPYIGWFSCCL